MRIKPFWESDVKLIEVNMGSKMILTVCLALLAIGNLVNGRSVQNKATTRTVMYTGPGSNPKLKEVILKRCAQYFTIPSHQGLASASPGDCQNIWNAFYEAFAFKDPCKPATYKTYIDMTSGPLIPNNKALFWSGTPTIASVFADEGIRKVVLANLLTGWLVKDNLAWCGSTSTPDGVNYKNCPTSTECPQAKAEFWKLASIELAKRSVGVASVLLHGSNPKGYSPYRSESFFGAVELPYMDRNKVTEIHAMIVHPKGMKIIESCNGQSMKRLQDDIKNRHNGQIKYSCVDDPPEVRPFYPF